jgi:hypothetical protein
MMGGALRRSVLFALFAVAVLFAALPAQASDFAFSGWQMADADGVVNLPIWLSTLADPRVFDYMPAPTSDWYPCPSPTQINWYTSSNCTAYVQAYYKYFRTYLYVSGAMGGQTIYVRADGHIDDVVNVVVNGANTGQYIHGLALPGSRQANITAYLHFGQVNEILFRFADTAALNRGITLVSIRTGTGTLATYDPTVEADQVTITSIGAAPLVLPAGGGTTQCSMAATDSLGHPLSYSWIASSSLGTGTFNDPASPTPTWTSPANNTGSDVTATLTVTVTCNQGKSAQASVTVVIPPTQPPRQTAITRFGQNYWNWTGSSNIFSDYRGALGEKVRASGVSFLRFGGRENEVFVGSDERTSPPPDKWCRFTADDLRGFLEFCDDVGAEPIVQIPVWGYLMENWSDEDIVLRARDLVLHCAHQSGHRIRYWSIGNEPDLWELFARLEHGQWSFRCSPEKYCAIFNQIAAGIHEVDPEATVIGPDLGVWLLSPDFGSLWDRLVRVGQGQVPQLLLEASRRSALTTWIDTFLEQCAHEVDYFSIHYYPAPCYLDSITVPWVPEWARSRATVDLSPAMRQWAFHNGAGLLDWMIDYVKGKATNCGRPDLPIMVTETNIQGVAPGDQLSSSLDPTTQTAAVWLAQTMGQMVNHGVQAMCLWSIVADSGLDYLDEALQPRPTYKVFSLIANATAAMQRPVFCTVGGGPGDVGAWAVIDDAGTLVVVLFNRSQNARYAVQLLSSEGGNRRAAVARYRPVNVYVRVSWELSAGPITLSPQQVAVVTVRDYGRAWEVATYPE